MKKNKIMKKKLFLLTLLSFSYFVFSQVGIGTKNPDPSSALDINVDQINPKKGVLFPNVTLLSIDDKTTIPNPAIGLVIYNTGKNKNFSTPGFYFWNGTEWRLLDSSSGINPSINTLQCGSAMLTPPRYEKGKTYFGTITLPYTMGNGGKYFSGVSKTVNGLTYVLQGGELNYGNGNLFYTVTGTPTVSSPEGSLFELNFLDKSCKATLGDLNEIKSIQYARKYTDTINKDKVIINNKNNEVVVKEGTTLRSVTTIGNIQVRYNATKISSEHDSFIEFHPLVDTYVTIKYDKAGAGGQNLELWGKIAAKSKFYKLNEETHKVEAKDLWYKLADDSWTNPAYYPPYSSGAYPDLNSGLRDLGTVIIIFHNTQEIYRVTLNVNGNIARGNILDEDVPSGVTIFIEKLD
ncbi:hypothetical protein C4S77_03350 [Apibacter adventoris]|uniref:Uncharacterized protein n=2 Tax=Apibacter adventoris TaxID=1679466 RepID=A0A2S8AEZ4_9FLAO|nr:hypothetical protein C4S77_03350 [Apibacter adventoris]